MTAINRLFKRPMANAINKLAAMLKPKTNLNTPAAQNPYVAGNEGQRQWNDRYLNMAQAIRHWQWAFFTAMAVIIVFSVVLARMAMASKVEPFVVETNHGMPYAIQPMPALSADNERLVNFAMDQFIINARTVLTDTDAQKTLLDKVYAYSADNTLGFLHDYYQTHNPFTAASSYRVTVNIVDALPISRHTWQITWDEVRRTTQGGNVISVTRWMADLTYTLGDVNPTFLDENPFGLYITEVSWSQSLRVS